MYMNDGDHIYDVSVMGGGLGGLSLAIQCADAGFKVVLFEKETYPFHKVCGEYVSRESISFLDKMGVSLGERHLPRIDTLELSDAKGRVYSFELKTGGFGISRYLLDDLLFREAQAKGVEVLTGTKVTACRFDGNFFLIEANKQHFISKVCVGAFGKRSNLDVSWKRPFILQKPDKLNNYIGIKYHIRYPLASDRISLHNFSHGYCGISAIEDGNCCLCYLTTADNLKQNQGSVERMEQTVLMKNPQLKKIFSAAEFLYDAPLVISQISFAKKKQVENHVLMVGDAAGLITPLCGNGMSMAMHASKLAFESIYCFLQEGISREEMERSYVYQWKHHFSKRLFVGRNVQRFFGHDTSTSLFLSVMDRLPRLAGTLIRSTHGEPF